MDASPIQVELQEFMGSDAAIANAAWTSTYDKDRREDRYDDPDKVAGLVRRCVKEGHSTPLESVVMRFWIRMPIFTDRQHMTHRMASHNGLSGRYRTMPSDFYELPGDVAGILDKAKVDTSLGGSTRHSMSALSRQAHDFYLERLEILKQARADDRISETEYKRAREVLRMCLPVSNLVERTTIMNLVSFANYQRLRNSPHAQPEIREVAKKMLRLVVDANVAPVALEALMAKGWLIGEPNHNWEL